MSQISQKSISGITSITTPAGIDNQFTLHTNDTSQAAKLDTAGNFHFSNHVNTTGITSASNFKTGSSNLHSTGLTVGDSFVHSTGINIGSNIKFGSTGVITATSFVGDGSDLTNLPAGLGTALSATATSPLNKMYYTNAVLGIAATTTVDVPASASAAYTQYADINIATDADLIIADGDDLIPDVLGLADFGTFGGGTAGRLRVSSISNHTANGAPTVQHGLVVTGVTTSTTFSGSGASLTNIPSAQLTGALPALDGSNLTGLSGVSVANQSDNRLITATGTTDALNGESGLTYDGTTFKVGPGGVPVTGGALAVRGSANSTQASFSDNTSGTLRIATASGALNLLLVESGQSLVFGIGNNSGLSSEYLRITSGGYVQTKSELWVGGSAPVLRWRDTTHGEKATARISGSDLYFEVSNAERVRFTSTGNVCVGGHTAALSTYNSTQPRLSVYKSSGSGGYLELGGNIPHNGHSSGTILFINNDNSEATSNNANGKILAMQRVENVTSDTNAGDDMGGDLVFMTKPESGSLAERLRIRSDGQITTPTQCSFRATKSGGPFNTGGGTIVFDQNQHNIGSNYNTSNGRFTAPVDGTYIFHYYSIYQNNSSDDLFDFYKNGSSFAGSRMHYTNGGVSSNWDNITNTQIIELNANDYVEVYASDQTLHGGDWTHFCGHLLG